MQQDELQRAVYNQLIADLFSHAKTIVPATVFIASAIGFTLWGEVDHDNLLAWLAAAYLTAAVRFILFRTHSRLESPDPDTWSR